MPHSRRDFLTTTAIAGSLLGVPGGLAAARLSGRTARAAKPLRLLILGGTGFIGPHIVEAAIKRGHSMTLFNRGKTNSHLFAGMEKLKGDRDPDIGDGLKALEGRTWDAVIDTSGYVPRLVQASAEMLAGNIGQYLFISSVAAYASYSQPGMAEDAPTGTLDDPTVEDVNALTYGPLKALCEQSVARTFADAHTIIRPGLIVGPGDTTHRFTYWPVRIRRGGEVLAPGTSEMKVQYIDARDLASFVVHCLEAKTYGPFNAVGPLSPSGMGEMLHGCKAVTGGDAEFTWVESDFLTEQGVRAWQHMPAWVPPGEGYEGFGTISNARAVEAGMTYLPLARTVMDLLDWVDGLPENERRELLAVERISEDGTTSPLPGLTPARERAVLTAWKERS